MKNEYLDRKFREGVRRISKHIRETTRPPKYKVGMGILTSDGYEGRVERVDPDHAHGHWYILRLSASPYPGTHPVGSQLSIREQSVKAHKRARTDPAMKHPKHTFEHKGVLPNRFQRHVQAGIKRGMSKKSAHQAATSSLSALSLAWRTTKTGWIAKGLKTSYAIKISGKGYALSRGRTPVGKYSDLWQAQYAADRFEMPPRPIGVTTSEWNEYHRRKRVRAGRADPRKRRRR